MWDKLKKELLGEAEELYRRFFATEKTPGMSFSVYIRKLRDIQTLLIPPPEPAEAGVVPVTVGGRGGENYKGGNGSS